MVHMSIWKVVSRMSLNLFVDTVKPLVPECDSFIEDIVNECITSDITDRIVAFDLRDVKLSDSIKKKIQDEFIVLSLMKFNQNSHEIFRKWYVDGRIYIPIRLLIANDQS